MASLEVFKLDGLNFYQVDAEGKTAFDHAVATYQLQVIDMMTLMKLGAGPK
jgi:hypothetical protein